MKREEAIKYVDTAFNAWESEYRVPNESWENEHKARDMAIEALSNADQHVQHVGNVDLISRQAAVDAIEARHTEQWIDSDVDYNNGLESALCEIKALPSAEPKTGKWVKGKYNWEWVTDSNAPTDLISRQDAINLLMKRADELKGITGDLGGACNGAAKLVERLPSAEPNPLCALADRGCPFQGKEYAWCLTCPHISEEDRDLVKKALSEPKTGEWITDIYKHGKERYMCSNCGRGHTEDSDYCPNCGADMRKGDNNGNGI